MVRLAGLLIVLIIVPLLLEVDRVVRVLGMRIYGLMIHKMSYETAYMMKLWHKFVE